MDSALCFLVGITCPCLGSLFVQLPTPTPVIAIFPTLVFLSVFSIRGILDALDRRKHRAYLRHCAHFGIRRYADTDWSHYPTHS